MPATGLDHCIISVSDWDRANEFYATVVGAQLVPYSDGRWSYRFGDQLVNVHGPGTEEGVIRPQFLPSPGSGHVCLVWDGSIDEAASHLASHGVAVEEGPVERTGARGDGRSVYFRDPDGNLLEFISYAGPTSP